MITKFGTAKIYRGYYIITSRKEGNHGKFLHRLIFEDFYKIKLPKHIIIHHNNENKLDNHIWNLIPMSKEEHSLLHIHKNPEKYKPKHTDESKRKISENNARFWLGKKMPKNVKDKISKTKSKSNNTTGYYRVNKLKDNSCKQGFIWQYRYYDEGKRKNIVSVNIDKLKEKVIAKGLEWIEFEKEVIQ